MRRTITAVAVVLMVLGALASAGCTRVKLADNPSTAIHNDRVSIPLGSAEKLGASIRSGVGELSLSGEPSSTAALDAAFRYAPASWKPEVQYSVDGTTGVLVVSQPDDSGVPFGRADNSWELVLGGGVPTDLSLKLGVGESTVDLSRVDVRDVEIVTGVGQATIDLTGARTADVGGRIECGVGDVTVRLPKDVGVRVTGGTTGVGNLDANGFTKDGDALVNAAWSGTGPKIDLMLTRGVGDTTLELAE